MKIIKRIILALALLFLFLIVSSVLIMHFYGKEVTRHVLSEISNSTQIPIRVSEVQDISMFRKFPFASMTLLNVEIREDAKKANADTLLYLKKVYLQFNILDIIQKDYKIKRISLADGFVKLRIDKNGKENYQALLNMGKDKKADEEDEFLLKLSRVKVSDFFISYHNDFKKQHIEISCSESVFRGNFSGEQFLLNMDGSFFTDKINMAGDSLFEKRNITLKAEVAVDKRESSFIVKSGEIAVNENILFALSGSIRDQQDATFTDLDLRGQKMDIVSVINLLPGDYKNLFADYESSGAISFTGKINGTMSKDLTPSISFDFTVENGSVKQKSSSYSLSSIHLSGAYANGKQKNSASSSIDIKECAANFCFDGNSAPGESINAKFLISNFIKPQIELSANAKIDAVKLAGFFSIDTLEQIHGTAEFTINYAGALKSKEEYSSEDFRNAKCSGTVNLENIFFRLKHSNLDYQDFIGSIILENNDMLIKDLKGKISSSDFELNGIFRNALSYMFLPDEKLTVEAVLSSENLDLNEILKENESSKDTSYLLAFPGKVNFNLNASVGHLTFRKFNADDLSGIVLISDKQLRSENISFKTMDGNVKATLEINAYSPVEISVFSNASISSIDINKLFSDFENFGQDVISSKHLKGKASAEVLISLKMDSAMNVSERDISSLANLTIEQGELINFEAMDDISGYIKNHFFLKRIIKGEVFEKKLKHIRFSTLQNRIEIKDRKIVIPAMTIHSSALNIEAEGSHSFDNEIDYRMNFFLSELLIKKEDVSQTEFGEIEDDGTGKKKIFLRMKGPLDDPEITYDKKKVKSNLAEEAKHEKKLVKGIFKEEFGWFKNDSAAIQPKKTNKEDFLIEWEENKVNKNDSAITGNKNKQSAKEKNINKLFGKTSKEEKKIEEDFEIEKGEDF